MNLLLLLWLGFAGLLSPQSDDSPKAHATLYARAEGADVRAAIEIRIDPGWHLYHGPTRADLGPEDAVGKPTKVDFAGAGIEWSLARFPAPERVVQDFGEPTYIHQHSGTIVVYARGRKVDPGADVGALSVTLDGQTCDEGSVCLPYGETVTSSGAGPDALFAAFPSDLLVGAQAIENGTPPDGPGAATGAAAKPAGEPAKAAPAVTAPAATTAAEQAPGGELGLLEFLLSAIGWGLFTLLMPCTYPMIPITISYFTKQAAQRKASVLPLSLAYGAGIVLIFVLIGVTVGPLIIPFAQHPVTNLIIGGFFLLFALALFGVVDLSPPASLMNLAGQASRQGGYLGVFLMGATLVITSFTCTAPFVGTLLATGAASGDLGRVALGMGVFGATMAVPFVFLSLVPDRVKAMPRSGEWMHVLKVTLGFVEVAAALKFLSNVDLVWNWGWLSRELFLFLWLGIFLAAAMYLFGLVRLKDEGTNEIGPKRMVAALGFFLFAIYCGYGALGNSLDPIMLSLVPPYSNREAPATIGRADGGADEVAKDHVIVKDDYAAAVARAAREKKLVFVNFTGFT